MNVRMTISEMEAKILPTIIKYGDPINFQTKLQQLLVHQIAALSAQIFMESVNSGLVPSDWEVTDCSASFQIKRQIMDPLA